MNRISQSNRASESDVIIVGGSYAGLSAAMALGRSLRTVLIVDGGEPCNRSTPYSHNFLLADGLPPAAIAQTAREQVLRYPTVQWKEGRVTMVFGSDNAFEVITETGERFHSRKLLFATGIKDTIPSTEGFSACWGISILHCPYCHGYEVRGQRTGILAHGKEALEFVRLISNWTRDLTLFTNGEPAPGEDEFRQAGLSGIPVIEPVVTRFSHRKGQLQHLVTDDGNDHIITALYARLPFRQHCQVPEALGCELDGAGFLVVDEFQRTTVRGIYAAGDNSGGMRSVSNAVAAGNRAGAVLNRELLDEEDRFRGSPATVRE